MENRIIEILKEIKLLEEKKTNTKETEQINQQIEKLKTEYNKIVEEIKKTLKYNSIALSIPKSNNKKSISFIEEKKY